MGGRRESELQYDKCEAECNICSIELRGRSKGQGCALLSEMRMSTHGAKSIPANLFLVFHLFPSPERSKVVNGR